MLFFQYGNGINVVRTIFIRCETPVYNDIQSQAGNSQLLDVLFQFGKECISLTIDAKRAEPIFDILDSAVMDSRKQQPVLV